MNTFKKHSSGNYGMYGLNLFRSEPVIQMNGDIWKFLWWEKGKKYATFINSKGSKYTFQPSIIYYSEKRNVIVRMEEHFTDECKSNKNKDNIDNFDYE